MTLRQKLVFLSMIAVLFALDLWTKHWAFLAVPTESHRITVIDGFFYLRHVRNPGAMWSIGQNVPREVWIALRSTVFLVLFTYVWRQRDLKAWFRIAFALILGGALGNLYDNLFAKDGMVRDFVSWVFWGWPFPVFNLADSGISVGATMLFLGYALHDFSAWRARRAVAQTRGTGADRS